MLKRRAGERNPGALFRRCRKPARRLLPRFDLHEWFLDLERYLHSWDAVSADQRFDSEHATRVARIWATLKSWGEAVGEERAEAMCRSEIEGVEAGQEGKEFLPVTLYLKKLIENYEDQVVSLWGLDHRSLARFNGYFQSQWDRSEGLDLLDRLERFLPGSMDDFLAQFPW